MEQLDKESTHATKPTAVQPTPPVDYLPAPPPPDLTFDVGVEAIRRADEFFDLAMHNVINVNRFNASIRDMTRRMSTKAYAELIKLPVDPKTARSFDK